MKFGFMLLPDRQVPQSCLKIEFASTQNRQPQQLLSGALDIQPSRHNIDKINHLLPSDLKRELPHRVTSHPEALSGLSSNTSVEPHPAPIASCLQAGNAAGPSENLLPDGAAFFGMAQPLGVFRDASSEAFLGPVARRTSRAAVSEAHRRVRRRARLRRLRESGGGR